ncbi:MAG: phosphoadenylyl-sulfate reductase [Candidatus Omnitrophota bacterium]
MDKEAVLKRAAALEGAEPKEVLAWALKEFGASAVALATSFGAEDQVLTDMLCAGAGSGKPGIFTLDTLRLPPETHAALAATNVRYGLAIEVITPDAGAVEAMVAENGPDQFYKSIDLRKQCCEVRKVVPLRRKLSTLKAWICGLRRDQAVTRAGVAKVSWDDANGLFKICPLADWSEADVWAYIKKNKVPYNTLHDKGYPSIGCAPCTRAVKPGEGVRAGRWWWENPEHKECGLHSRRKA